MKLDEKHYEIPLIKLFSALNPLSRKKSLQELHDMVPPKTIFDKLLSMGSPEVIIDMFRLLTKRENPVLKNDCTAFLKSELVRLDDSEQKGIIRASIENYLQAVGN